MVTSVKVLYAWLYNHGLMNPSGFLPAARRASLTRAMMAAKVGLEAEVPPMVVMFSAQTITSWLP